MADFYCDVSAIGNEYQAYADIPATWGVPQDGNGKAGPGHSAAVAIATIDCASASASGAGQLSLLGQTVSSTLTGSGATLATNIAAAINAYSTAVIATYSAQLLPLNKLVYARVNPGTSTQVQIMMRIAGVDWNDMVPASAGTWGTAPTMGAFAGGANGPFAYVLDSGTLFGKATLLHGTWFGTASGVTDPGSNDVIHYRTKRGGTNLSQTWTTASTSATNVTWKNRNHLYDNGTIWSGDNGTLSVNLAQTYATGTQVNLAGATSALLSHVSRGYRNLDIAWNAVSTSTTFNLFYQGVGGRYTMSRCGLLQVAANGGALNLANDNGASCNGNVLDFLDNYVFCRLTTRGKIAYSASLYTRTKLNGSQWVVEAASGSLAGIYNMSYTAAERTYVEWIGGSMTDTNGVYGCGNPIVAAASSVSTTIVIDNVLGVVDAAIGWTASGTTISSLMWNAPEGTARGFKNETAQYIVDWKDNGTFPHCGAQNLKGAYWSHRITWNASPNRWNAVTPLKLAMFYRGATAVKTFKLELLTPDATPFYLDEFDVAVSYIDDTGQARTDDCTGTGNRGMQGSATRDSLPTSAASWTLNGVANFSPKKFEVTTLHPVMTGTEVTVRVSLCASRTPTIVFYVSPQVIVS